MPATLNGIGTTFYGSCDFHLDGSYVTTEWLVLVYLPVLPLRSYRLTPTEGGFDYGFWRRTTYEVQGRVPLHCRQVMRVYLFIAALGLLVAAGAGLNDVLVQAGLVEKDPVWDMVRTVAAVAVAIAVPFAVRAILLTRARSHPRIFRED
jgi:hypothetical protein